MRRQASIFGQQGGCFGIMLRVRREMDVCKNIASPARRQVWRSREGGRGFARMAIDWPRLRAKRCSAVEDVEAPRRPRG